MLSQYLEIVTFRILPLITYIVFTLGVTLKISSWIKHTYSVFVRDNVLPLKELTLSIVLQSLISTISRYVLQFKLLRGSYKLWIVSWIAFHIPVLFIIFGHLRGFGVWSLEWFTWIAPKEFLKYTLPTILGIVVMTALIILVMYRLIYLRSVSSLGNYIVLFLLILVIVTGNLMRFSPFITEEKVIVIPPGFTLRLEHIPDINLLLFHSILVQTLVMYVPFSPLVHIYASPFLMIINEVKRIRMSES
ncbi:MAG: respiratory nitrate reductase subunit gamma [Candidatus Methanomethylicia archaeon]